MTYVVLFVMMLLFLIVSLILSRGDAVDPSVIVSTAFALAALCALLGVGNWNYVNMTSGSALIIIVGVISFLVTSWVIQACSGSKTKDTNCISSWWTHLANLNVSTWKILLLCVYVVVAYALYWHEIVKVNAFYGLDTTSVSNVLGDYRSLNPIFSDADIENDVNGFVLQMRKICDAIFVVAVFGFINRLINGKGVSKSFLFLLLVCAAGSLMTTGRSKLMAYIVAAAIIWIFLRQRYKGRFRLKQYLRLGVVVCGSMLLFYGLLTIVGRETSMNLIDYITSYLGYGIPSFDLMMSDSRHFGFTGIDIFAGLLKPLSMLGITDPLTLDSQYWIRYSSGASNIFTAMKDYYCVGGLIGMIVCEVVFSAVFSLLYKKASKDFSPIWLIIYAMYGYVLVDQIRAETFFKNIVTVNIVIYVIAIALIAFFLFGKPVFKREDHITKG